MEVKFGFRFLIRISVISKKLKGKEEKVVLEEEVNDKGSVINIRFRLEYEDSVI